MDFYRNLPALELSPEALLAHRQYFHLLPSDWQIIVADIKGSTAAFQAGKYSEINLLASSCVIAALNVAHQRGHEIPFIYGGDGATIAAPSELASEIIAALGGLSQRARQIFQLELRVGSISVAEIERAEHLVKIAKIHVAPGYNQALFLDDGLYFAEQKIKDNPGYQINLEQNGQKQIETKPDLSGLQCRWSAINAPEQSPEVMCLIVYANNPARHDAVYREVLNEIERVYGNFGARHPLRDRLLASHFSWRQVAWESYVKFGRLRWFYIFKLILSNFQNQKNKSESEHNQVIAGSDILKLDGSLKTVIAGTADQHELLIDFLKEREAQGELQYGHALGESSFVTCFVPQDRQTINFLDGAQGGYIRAATELKQKLKNR